MIEFDHVDNDYDQRLRDASDRLRAHAAPRSSAGPVPTARPPSRRLAAVTVTVLVAAAIVGLFVVGQQTHRFDPADGAADPRWLVTKLPDGWATANVVGPTGTTSFSGAQTAIYGTTEGAQGSLFQIDASPPPTEDFLAVNQEQRSISGRAMTFADSKKGQRLVYSRTPNGWARITAINTTDDVLASLVAGIVMPGSEQPSIYPPVLPPGTRPVYIGWLWSIAPTVWDGLYTTQPVYGTSSNYNPPDRREPGATMATAPSTSTEQLWLALNAKILGDATLAAGPATWVSNIVGETFHSLYWQRNGISFLLGSPTLTDAQIIDAANSVQQASTAEWNRRMIVGPGSTVPGETVLAKSPPVTPVTVRQGVASTETP